MSPDERMVVAERAAFDPAEVRSDFPILGERPYGKKLVYFDSAASAQKPRQVIDAISHVYETEYANVHRGVHYLSQRATDAMEGAREKVRAFINAGSVREVIFVRGATEGINLVASSWGRANLKEGDEIVLSQMEHHSNIVPWQLIAGQTGARLRVVPIDDAGALRMEEYEKAFSPRTKIVAITHVSNALGTVVPIAEVIRIAHENGVPVLVDGCQAAPHMPLDVRALDADFYVFSGHKLYGPSGIGVLYGKESLLEAMPPYQGGGEMIDTVTFEKSTWADLPFKFEAGTPNIADAIGLGAAVDYLTALDLRRVGAYEDGLLAYATAQVGAINSVRLIGTAKDKTAILSFELGDIHPHDVGTIMDREGIAVRTGHHCAQPVMERYDVAATVRLSIGLYNTREEVDAAVAALAHVQKIFSR